jgi:hypothetical protein
MSYIDTFSHEFVGFFAGLPIYRSLVKHTENDESPAYFSCTIHDFIVGGGAGEHPALLIRSPNEAVSYYFRAWLEAESGLTDEAQALLEEKLLPYPDWEKVFSFCGWGVETYAAFLERCKSNVVVTPYNESEFGFFENWLYASFGEFIFFSFPEFAPLFISNNQEIANKIKYSFINNVLILPSGFIPKAGAIYENGKVSIGISAWNVTKKNV